MSISVINAFYPFALNLIIILQAIELILKMQLKDGLKSEEGEKMKRARDEDRENRPYMSYW